MKVDEPTLKTTQNKKKKREISNQTIFSVYAGVRSHSEPL